MKSNIEWWMKDITGKLCQVFRNYNHVLNKIDTNCSHFSMRGHFEVRNYLIISALVVITVKMHICSIPIIFSGYQPDVMCKVFAQKEKNRFN